jgi:hypothetical protein
MKIKQTFTLKNTIPYLAIQNYKLHIKLKSFGVEMPSDNKEEVQENEEFLFYGNMLLTWGSYHISPYEETDLNGLNLMVKKRTSFSFKNEEEHHFFLENQRGRDEYEFLNLPGAVLMNLNPDQIWSARFYKVSYSKKYLLYFIASLSKFISVKPSFLYLGYLLNEKNNRIHRVKFKNSIKKKKLWFYGKGYAFWKQWLRHRIFRARRKRRRWLIKKRIKKMKAIYAIKYLYPTPSPSFLKKKKRKYLKKFRELCAEKFTDYVKKCAKIFSSESGYALKFSHVLFVSYPIKRDLHRQRALEILEEYQDLYYEFIKKKEAQKEKEKKSRRMRRRINATSFKFYQLATVKKNSFFYLKPLRIVNRSRKRNNAQYYRFLFKIKSRRKKKNIFVIEKPIIDFLRMDKKDQNRFMSGKKLRHLRVKFAIAHLQFQFPTFKVI